jgi:hypothetical protein
VLIRLDRSQQYEDLVERVIEVGEGAVPVLREGQLRALQVIAALWAE